jgi:hypothetical protein
MNLRVRRVTWESAMLELCRSGRGQQCDSECNGDGYSGGRTGDESILLFVEVVVLLLPQDVRQC